jgi:hypothetical protein
MRANSRLITGLDVAHATAISSGVPPPAACREELLLVGVERVATRVAQQAEYIRRFEWHSATPPSGWGAR